jgi:hypothetical protein
LIEAEKPECREEHESDVYPGIIEGGKTEKKLANHFIDDKDNFSF